MSVRRHVNSLPWVGTLDSPAANAACTGSYYHRRAASIERNIR
jgi:hypothetical protein